MANNSLDTLPTELGQLHALRSLDASHNRIAARIPYALGEMQAMRVLDLSCAPPRPSNHIVIIYE